METKILYTTAEAAAYLTARGLRISASTLYSYRSADRGQGPRSRRIDGQVRYSVDDLDAYLAGGIAAGNTVSGDGTED